MHDIENETWCVLNDDGKAALRDLLKLVYQNADWKPATIAKSAGMPDRGTITTILNSLQSNPNDSSTNEPVKISSLVKIFDGLFSLIRTNELKITYLQQHHCLDLIIATDEEQGQIQGSCYRRTRCKFFDWVPPPIKKPKYICEAQTIADLLCHLDYNQEKQQPKFINRVENEPSQAIAFSLSAPDLLLQQWLLHRLSLQVDGKWRERATLITLDPQRKKESVIDPESSWTLSEICNLVKNQLPEQPKIDNSSDATVIKLLFKYSLKHPVLIKVSNLRSGDRQIFINEFWNPLFMYFPVNESLSTNVMKNRLILFLIEDFDEDSIAKAKGMHGLAAFKAINETDMNRWALKLEKELKKYVVNIRSSIKNICTSTYFQQQDLTGIFQQICTSLSTSEHTLTDIADKYWKI
jgi:hypothetical protein